MNRLEAIEIVRKSWPISRNIDLRNALETLVPELAESEDDRMIKAILSAIRGGLDTEKFLEKHGTNYEEVEAYLEKQKEQPKEELVYRLNGFMQEYVKEGKDAAEKEHRFKCYQLFWDALEDENFFEQKEQKPDDDPLDDPKFIKGFDTGREVQRIFDEQKPAEWSEEDEHRRQQAINALDRNGYYVLVDWLKSLRPSWKPSEEQMEALLNAEGLVRANNYPENAKILAELYEQLKKL